jgi:hypothetical protein
LRKYLLIVTWLIPAHRRAQGFIGPHWFVSKNNDFSIQLFSFTANTRTFHHQLTVR